MNIDPCTASGLMGSSPNQILLACPSGIIIKVTTIIIVNTTAATAITIRVGYRGKGSNGIFRNIFPRDYPLAAPPSSAQESDTLLLYPKDFIEGWCTSGLHTADYFISAAVLG